MTYHDFEIYFALVVLAYCVAVMLSLSIHSLIRAWLNLWQEVERRLR